VKSKLPVAFVLINTQPGSEGEALRSLRKIEGIEEAYSLYGPYDIVAKIHAESIDDLKDIVTSEIRRSNKVRTTLMMVVTE